MKKLFVAVLISLFSAAMFAQEAAGPATTHQPSAAPSNVPPIPGYVPRDAVHYTLILSGNKAGDEAMEDP